MKSFLSKLIAAPMAFYIAIMSDPDIVLRPNNPDPYSAWFIYIAKMKKKIFFWRTYKS